MVRHAPESMAVIDAESRVSIGWQAASRTTFPLRREAPLQAYAAHATLARYPEPRFMSNGSPQS